MGNSQSVKVVKYAFTQCFGYCKGMQYVEQERHPINRQQSTSYLRQAPINPQQRDIYQQQNPSYHRPTPSYPEHSYHTYILLEVKKRQLQEQEQKRKQLQLQVQKQEQKQKQIQKQKQKTVQLQQQSHSKKRIHEQGQKEFQAILAQKNSTKSSSPTDLHSGQPSKSSQDDECYTNLRSLATEEAERRKIWREMIKKASKNGNRASVHIYAKEVKKSEKEMKKWNKKAADYIFEKNNKDRPSVEIDLHGLHVAEALAKFEERIKACQREKTPKLLVIAGKGKHSPNQVAKVKPAILKFLEKKNVRIVPAFKNDGCFWAVFEYPTGNSDLHGEPSTRVHVSSRGNVLKRVK